MFGTIAAESQRMINEPYSAIIVDQEPIRATIRSTGGMCPRCEGIGSVNDIALHELFDENLSLAAGALKVPGYTPGGWNHRLYAASGFFPADKPIRQFSKRERHDLLYREPTRMKIENITMTYEGLIPQLQRPMLSKDVEAMQISDLAAWVCTLDEPTIGLHPHGIQRMNELLLQLRDKGNTVLVIEHKPETIAIADHAVDLDPGAGTSGGRIVFEGSVDRSVSPREGVVTIDQAPIRGSRRSSPATYTSLLEPIRKAFARANGVKPSLFSANSEGACPTCKGSASPTPSSGS